jgi:hypothetical protein
MSDRADAQEYLKICEDALKETDDAILAAVMQESKTDYDTMAAQRAQAAEKRMNAGNAQRAQAAGNHRNAVNAPAAGTRLGGDAVTAVEVAPAAAATNAALNRLEAMATKNTTKGVQAAAQKK